MRWSWEPLFAQGGQVVLDGGDHIQPVGDVGGEGGVQRLLREAEQIVPFPAAQHQVLLLEGFGDLGLVIVHVLAHFLHARHNDRDFAGLEDIEKFITDAGAQLKEAFNALINKLIGDAFGGLAESFFSAFGAKGAA